MAPGEHALTPQPQNRRSRGHHTEAGEGVGKVHYNEDYGPLAIHNTVCTDGGEGGRVLLTPATRQDSPGRIGHFKCLRESSSSLTLAPHPEGISGMWLRRSPIPLPRRTASPRPPALQVLVSGGEGWCVTFCPPPPLSGLGDRGKQGAIPVPVRGRVTSCCGVCPGTWCSCSAGGSLFW